MKAVLAQPKYSSKLKLCLVYISTLLLVLLTLALFGYAPFGDLSLACDDGYYQYMDFFAYYKDVLAGKQSLLYSLSNGLGAANLPLFLYYLASPFNLIIIFFQKTQLHSFFDTVIALKLAMTATTMFWYIGKRFQDKVNSLFAYTIALSYAFMQYSFAQASNTMWLDGVYMLPIILYGIYVLVEQENIVFLAISVFFAILFNWYTAGINCVFTFFWFVLELFINTQKSSCKKNDSIRKDTEKLTEKTNTIGKIALKYLISMMLGVGLSSFFFLPNFIHLKSTPRGDADLSAISFSMRGNLLNLFSGYNLGGVSTPHSLSIFAGSFVLIGTLGFFGCKAISAKKKLVCGSVLLIAILSCYFQPLFFVFSLFQSAGSYYYRHSYLCVFVLCFLAASFFVEKKDDSFKNIIILLAAFCVIDIACCMAFGYEKMNLIYITVVFHVIVMAVIIAYQKTKSSKNEEIMQIAHKYNIAPILLSLFIVIVVASEMIFNAKLLLEKYHSLENIQSFAEYEQENQELIDSVKSMDDSYYRMTQTSTRSKGIYDTANLNEPMAFNYWGIEQYTSMPDAYQIDFLKKVGYKVYDSRIVEKLMSQIAIDSLLGTKYILSSYPYEEYDLISEIPVHNQKSVYYNSYSMPFAFTIPQVSDFSSKEKDPMKFQNQLFSFISGDENEEIFIKADFDTAEEEKTRTYTINILEGNYALYGYVDHKRNAASTLDLNGKMNLPYGSIHSISYFYVPVCEGDRRAYVTISSDNLDKYKEPKFYLLDLNALKTISERANENAPSSFEVNGAVISCKVDANEGESLFTSIPYVQGMKVAVNGNSVKPSLIQNCLMLIPLENGENEIIIRYTIPYLHIGILLSFVSATILMVLARNKYKCD